MEWLFSVLRGAASGLVGALDAFVPAVPAEVSESCRVIETGMTSFSFLGFFVPFEAMFFSLGLLLATALAVLAIRTYRIGVSAMTGGGGA